MTGLPRVRVYGSVCTHTLDLPDGRRPRRSEPPSTVRSTVRRKVVPRAYGRAPTRWGPPAGPLAADRTVRSAQCASTTPGVLPSRVRTPRLHVEPPNGRLVVHCTPECTLRTVTTNGPRSALRRGEPRPVAEIYYRRSSASLILVALACPIFISRMIRRTLGTSPAASILAYRLRAVARAGLSAGSTPGERSRVLS